MTEIVFVDQVTQGLERLITQWKDKPNVVGLLTSYLENVQEVQDTYQQLNDERGLETAIGAQLDVLGIIIGESRVGRNDTDYRVALKTRIAINTSDGTEPKITEALKILTGVSNFSVRDSYPAAIRVVFGVGLEESELQAIFDALDQIVSATILPALDAEFELVFDDGNTLGVSQSPDDNFSVITSITS